MSTSLLVKVPAGLQRIFLWSAGIVIICSASCTERKAVPTQASINEIKLKRGPVISCGPADHQFGDVSFETSCTAVHQKDFNLAIALLHSFEYDEAEKVFAGIIDAEPGCAMAYWGVAMCSYHPLWTPPSAPELAKGSRAIKLAQSVAPKSEKESGYINALAAFYAPQGKVDVRHRAILFESGMEKLYSVFKTDIEVALFYALSLDAAADPADKSCKNQRKAGAILQALYTKSPNHPGIAHYIIHSFDYPELAPLALEVARRYAAVAPSSAHAQHMPSHIFTRLGLWDDCIKANLVSVDAARCYAQAAGLNAHWDEELHGLDYLVYAYLQKNEDSLAKAQLDYLETIAVVKPINFKVAYAFAAIPSRYLLETRHWKEAAALKLYPSAFPWKEYPWQEAIVHFTRVLGMIHTGKFSPAREELLQLNHLRETLLQLKDDYKANQVAIQLTSARAWIEYKAGSKTTALALMKTAAAMEDKTEKHPVTPGEVIPAQELLGDMLLDMQLPADALLAYQADLQKHPLRFNGLMGAAIAANENHSPGIADSFYRLLPANTSRLTAAGVHVR